MLQRLSDAARKAGQQIVADTISTVVTVVLLLLALTFALLGFLNAPDSEVSPGTVATYMVASAVLFVGLAAFGLTRSRPWQRAIGAGAAVGAIYMVVMAVLFFRALSAVEMPF